jgi:hypothetical protein
MKHLFWLCYRRANKLEGVVIIEATELLQARMLAAIDGLDKLADFSGGYELSIEQAAMISPSLIGRMISPEEAGGVLSWIESEAARKNMAASELEPMLEASDYRASEPRRRSRHY